MHWFTILLIGIAANLDNLGIGVSYSLRQTRIPFISNILIAMVSMVFAYLSIATGHLISHYISLTVANFIGGLLIVFLGAKCITDGLKKEIKESQQAIQMDANFSKMVHDPVSLDLNNDQVISSKESIFLGFALAINCVGIGLGAGITGVSSVFATISIGIFSVFSISCGALIGFKMVGTKIGKYSNMAAGLLLIFIGLYEMIV